MVSSQSGSFDTLSSIGRSSLNSSSGSFSLLPAVPKIFHGRDSELEEVVNGLLTLSARVAILGPGGMGKTVLAVAALHHTRVAARYPNRHFIPCDSAQNRDSLVATIWLNLGQDMSHGSEKYLIRYLSTGPPCLIILDNFETTWEPMNGRAKVEQFLELLADITHLGLLITMRGAERPGQLQWTRPFLKPLLPLTHDAARQMFIEIADEVHNDSAIDHLLDATDHIPLAVQLMAIAADSEGCQSTFERWKQESTAMISAGYDKRSNLDMSIGLSLSSPRMLSLPQAADLLSLMSLLSDGISDLDLAQSKLPIPDLLKCKTTLIRTSLAYVGGAGAFKVLGPIREYIQKVRPPSTVLVRPLRKHLSSLLNIWANKGNHSTELGRNLTPRLVSNFGNLHSMLQHGLDSDHTDIQETIRGVMMLSNLSLRMNRGLTPLLHRLPETLDKINDPELSAQFGLRMFEAWQFSSVVDPEKLILDTVEHFRKIGDLHGEAHLYSVVAGYYYHRVRDPKQARTFYGRALALAAECDSVGVKLGGLIGLAPIEFSEGNRLQCLSLAQEAHKIGIATGNTWGELYGIRWQVISYKGLGHLNRSLELAHHGRVLVARTGFQGGEIEVMLMNSEADAHQLKTEYAKARSIYEIILRQTSVALSPLLHAYTLLGIATVDIATGSRGEAVLPNLDAAVSIFRNVQYTRGIMACDLTRANLELREGNEVSAGIIYTRLFTAIQSDDHEIAYLTLHKLAGSTNPVHAVQQRTRWAIVFLAFTLRSPLRNMLGVHQALQCLGDVLAHQAMDDEALNALTMTLEGFTWMDVHQSRAECMQSIGDLHLRRGERPEAFKFWKAAKLLFEQSLQTKSVAGIDHRLAEAEHQANLEQLSKLNTPDLFGEKLPIALEKLDGEVAGGGVSNDAKSAVLDVVQT
ncbi:hypothetical protein K438DRAFT_445228 [Mycena galopus ATCC 62051]|nr:hypothetical protein K438DRAFT_445228 [Mycena galopus ATCC 62051]